MFELMRDEPHGIIYPYFYVDKYAQTQTHTHTLETLKYNKNHANIYKM